MADDEGFVPPQFVLQTFDREILRGPSEFVETGYVEDATQHLQLQVFVYDGVRAILTRKIWHGAVSHFGHRAVDLHAAYFMLETCRYRLSWTELRRNGWIIMIHRRPLEEMTFMEPSTSLQPLEKPGWVTAWRPVPDWALGIRMARIANEPAGHRTRSDLLALRNG